MIDHNTEHEIQRIAFERHNAEDMIARLSRTIPEALGAAQRAAAHLDAGDVQALKPMPLADDAVIVMTQAEDKTMSLKRLIGVFSHTIAEFDVYGELTGHHVETLPAKRELEKLIKRLERECALLNGQPVEVWGETETVA